jgi:MOSC domain-containing protein YiiM
MKKAAGTIASIVYKPGDAGSDPEDRYLRVALDTAVLVAGHGIEGDRKGGNPKRQLNIMSLEALQTLNNEGFQTRPGEMGEQITIQGLDIDGLKKGDQIQIGEQARVEIISHRTGCDRFEHIQGKSPQLAASRMGAMASVVVGGTISVGSPVKLL